MMVSDGARTARLVALMAGNGYGFGQSFDWIRESMKTLSEVDGALLWVSIICFIGISGAYVALWRASNDRISVIAEGISVFGITNIAVGWLGYAQGWITADQKFH